MESGTCTVEFYIAKNKQIAVRDMSFILSMNNDPYAS